MSFLDMGDPHRPIAAVFLHANGFNALTYRQILAPLAMSYRLLAIDQRGHGDTTLEADGEGRGDWLDLRDDLLAFLVAMNLTQVVLTGHSMGGAASLLAASLEPARCRRLVLFDPVIIPPIDGPAPSESPLVQGARRRRAVFPDRQAAVASYRGRGAFKTWPDGVLTDYVAGGFHDLPTGEVTLACSPAWEASGFVVAGPEAWMALRAPPCATEIVRAESGSTCRLDGIDLCAEPLVTISTQPGSTHFLPMEFPALVQDTLARAMGPP